MKKLLILSILLLACPAWATTYTIGSDPSDNYATFAAFRAAHNEADGDVISFRRGDTFRPGSIVTPASGSSNSSRITYTAHGSGAKPKLLFSSDLSATGSWTDNTGNVWYATAATDIGNVIFNNEASVGVQKAALINLASQGDYFWDTGTSRLYLYSVGNPGTYYTHIEAVTTTIGFLPAGRNYITFEYLDIRYARFGIATYESTGLIIQYNDISWIGGIYSGSGIGNAIELGPITADCYVRFNTISQAYDAGLTTQGTEAAKTYSNHWYYYNTVDKAEYGFEFIMRGAGTTCDGIYVYNNTFTNNGSGALHAQRADPVGTGIQISDNNNAGITNVIFRNNRIETSVLAHVYFQAADDVANLDIDYSSYNPDGAAVFKIAANTYNFADWKTASSQDANSYVNNYIDKGIPVFTYAEMVALGLRVYGSAPDIGGSERVQILDGPKPPISGKGNLILASAKAALSTSSAAYVQNQDMLWSTGGDTVLWSTGGDTIAW